MQIFKLHKLKLYFKIGNIGSCCYQLSWSRIKRLNIYTENYTLLTKLAKRDFIIPASCHSLAYQKLQETILEEILQHPIETSLHCYLVQHVLPENMILMSTLYKVTFQNKFSKTDWQIWRFLRQHRQHICRHHQLKLVAAPLRLPFLPNQLEACPSLFS